MHGFARIRSYSSGSDDSAKDYGYVHSQQFLVEVEQAHGQNCIRCHKKVYSTEKVEVGVQLHKNCFRCRDCGLTLSLHNFILSRVGARGHKDVFCKAHAPKQSKNALDPHAIAIKNAVQSQQINKRDSFNTQIRLADVSGWQYDPKAREFEHAKALHERNKQRRPPGHDLEPDDIEYEKGDFIRRLREGEIRDGNVKEAATSLTGVLSRGRRPPGNHDMAAYDIENHRGRKQPSREHKFPRNTDYMEPNALWSPAAVEDPWNPTALGRTGNGYGDRSFMYENVVMDDNTEYIQEQSNGHHGRHHNPTKRPAFGNSAASKPSIPHQVYPPERIYERLNVLRPNENSVTEAKVDQSHYGSNGNGVHRPTSTDRQSKVFGTRQMYENCHPAGYPAVTGGGRLTLSRHKVPPAYFKEKKFVEQNQLELRQREEHDAMIRDLEHARENQIQRIEEEIRRQAEAAVADLFVHMDSGMFQGDINLEKLKIEQKFRRLREEKMKHLMSNLTGQERLRVDDMIDRQTQEMLQLIDQKVPNTLPAPAPPKKKKKALYTGPQIFDDIDFNAIQVAQYEQGSFTELIYELTRCCKNLLEKTRAIFRWLTFKNLNQTMFSEDLTEESPYYFLKGIKYGLESYHQLFKRLCSYAGIPVKIIRGLSKSVGYRPGMPFSDHRFKNSWAVVYIDGCWRFVDCHWGARHVSNPSQCDDPRAFCYELDEYYFLTDPDDMVYMHLPDESEWQLLDKHVSLEQFINLPVVKSHFFHYGIKFNGNVSAVLETDTGKVEFILNNSKKLQLAFNTRLESEGEELDGYCIHHYRDRQVIFNLTLPRKGVFFLSIFACDREKGEIYNNICSFRVVCTRVEEKPFCKFPKLPDGYGLTHVGEEVGLSAEKLDEYYLVCNDEKMILNLKFRCPVRVSQKLAFSRPNGDVVSCLDLRTDKDTELDRLVFQRFKDHSFVSYVIRFPERGIYIFSVFAGFSESKSQCLDCACRYLIQCNKKPSSPVRLFPKTLQYWHKCRLHEPTLGQLKLNKNVKFKVEVAKAEAVAVIVGQQWFYLKKDDAKKTWEGVAHTGKDAKISTDVYARYTDNEKDFFPLLEYKLVKDD